MNYLSFENVSKSYGDKLLFDNIALNIARGQKIALIASNGSGKTTLLRILAGEEAPEGENARIEFKRDVRTGYLRQEPDLNPDDSVLEAALDSENASIKAVKELERATAMKDNHAIQAAIETIEDLKAWDIEARVKEILGKFRIHDLDQKVSTLSGGQRKRLALARLLIDQPDFLILDEPTNHLDLDMIEWLESFLIQQNLTLFMVTHDRYFLERVCNEILELDEAQLHVYKGNYSQYLEKKEARILNEKARLDRTKKLFRKELDWMRRQPQARTTKAKARIDKFYEIKDEASKDASSDPLVMEIDMARLGGKILEAHNISKSFGELDIVRKFSYKFKKGERVGIAGPNGAGKTTFVNMLTGNLDPDSGKVVVGDTVVFGYYTQDMAMLKQDVRLIDSVREIAEYIPLKKGRKLTAESLLERFLFPRDHHRVFVSQLSGGEKRRLKLLRVLMGNPNFLILDEPTNDLDVITINVLEEFLLSFKGCVIVITHDRFFMDKIVDHLFILPGDGEVHDFNGSYSEFKKYKKQLAEDSSPAPASSNETSPVKKTQERKLSYQEKKELRNLENRIDKMEKEKIRIQEEFMTPDISGETIENLSKRLGEIDKEIEDMELRWMELSEIESG